MAAPLSAASPTSQLALRDYILIIDKSGTMCKKDPGCKVSRWNAVQESVYAIASKIIGLDPDGVSVYVFSGKFKAYKDVSSPESVNNIFLENEPMGGTVLAPVLRAAFTEYFTSKGTPKQKPNGATIIVVTDGEADDKTDVMMEISKAALSMTKPNELAISFIQVGKEDAASAYLKYLDESLSAICGGRDIVHTVKMDEIEDRGLTQVLIDAVFQGTPK